MKHTLPITLAFLMSFTHHLGAVELLVLQGDAGFVDMSHDGSRILVFKDQADCRVACGRYFTTTTDDPNNLTPLEAPGRDAINAQAISSSGEYVVGDTFEGNLPGRWNAQGEVEWLRLPDGKVRGTPYGISANGSVVVGAASTDDHVSHAYRWTIGGDMVLLPPLPGFDESRSFGVSADGHVAVGTSYKGDVREGTMWIHREHNSIEAISLERDVTPHKASHDGSFAMGRMNSDDGAEEAFRWSVGEGIVSLGRLPGASRSRPVAISPDGTLVVGNSSRKPSWVWDAKNGMRNLEAVLVDEHGVDPSAFAPENGDFQLRSMSGDTRAVGGYFFDDDGEAGNLAIYLDRPLVVTSGVTGDFNGNAELDVEDLGLLAKEVRSDRNVELFDLSTDSVVDFDDRRHWVHSLANTHFGDSNLDGEFNTKDLVTIFEAGEYEDDLELNSTWATGDWNGDGEFSTSDLVIAFEDGGYEKGLRPSAITVPEPTAMSLLTVVLITLVRCPRHR